MAKKGSKKASVWTRSGGTEKAEGGNDGGEVAWIAAYLREHGDSAWEAVREASQKAGLEVKPIHLRWGRKAAGLEPKAGGR